MGGIAVGVTCFVVIVMPLLYVPSLFEPAVTPRFVAVLLVGPILLAAWLGFLALRQPTIVIRSTVLPVGLVLLAAVSVVSLGWAPDRLGGLLWLAYVAGLACWFAFVAGVVRRADQASYVLAATGVGASVAALVGILQRFGIELPPFGQTVAPGSTFVHSNVAAQYFAIIVPVSLIMAMASRRGWVAILWAVAFLLSAAFLFFTRCRGAWIGAAGAVVLFLVVLLAIRRLRANLADRWSRRRLVVAAGALAALGVGFALLSPGSEDQRRASLGQMLDSFKDPLRMLAVNPEQALEAGSLMRWHMLRCAGGALRRYWLWGLGADGFRSGIVPYLDQKTASLCYRPDEQMLTLHCEPMQLLLELGVVGALASGMIVFAIVRAAWQLTLDDSEDESRWIGLTCVSGLAAVSIHSLVSFPFHMPTSAFLAATLAGILIGLQPTRREDPAGSRISGRHVVLGAASLAVLLAYVEATTAYGYGRAMLHLREATIAKHQGRGEQAIQEVNRALAASELPSVVRREYGVIHARFNRRRDQARQAVLRTLESDSHYINNLVNIAGVELDLHRYAAAKDHLKHALDINEELHLAHFAMGLIHLVESDISGARKSLQRTLELEPDFKPAKDRLDRLAPDSP